MFRVSELRRLAESYMAGTGETANKLSNRISRGSNNRLIDRFFEAKGIPSTEAATDFFINNWPNEARWPDDVPRPKRHACAAE